MLTDIFAAAPDSLSAYRAAGFPAPTSYGYPTVSARGVDPAALAVMDMLLSGVSADQALADATRTPVDEPDLYTGPVVAVLSERIVRLLPAVGEDRLAELAADWSAHVGLASAPATAVATWLGELRRLFRRAVAERRLLFVWNCL
ncbi:hypothetical protein [Actinomadura sp. 6N118]|uniref:hypothetical protein n=1 Tax=Actinomadura sp. 6N118 TaxID=3375151 RepID=UPI0037924D50